MMRQRKDISNLYILTEKEATSKIASYKNRRDQLIQQNTKRRTEKYWDAHQEEKAALESEKKTLADQVTALQSEVKDIPKNIDGYANMVELQKKVESLTSEKAALGLFKGKEKKAIQEQIDAANKEIAPIQSRINSAVEEVQKRIPPLESRIKEIDTELTKPR